MRISHENAEDFTDCGNQRVYNTTLFFYDQHYFFHHILFDKIHISIDFNLAIIVANKL